MTTGANRMGLGTLESYITEFWNNSRKACSSRHQIVIFGFVWSNSTQSTNSETAMPSTQTSTRWTNLFWRVFDKMQFGEIFNSIIFILLYLCTQIIVFIAIDPRLIQYLWTIQLHLDNCSANIILDICFFASLLLTSL